MNTTYDPNLIVPAHVMEAARTIELYFKERGTDSWELCGICSRDRLFRLESALKAIEKSRGWQGGVACEALKER